ncbi:MAG: competence/damage-inducible protein A [Nitrospina sp.]|jgi:nicotinamide-nucleotide amidase|nr:competence/damage-inducible protein A [Nitrospina sp.]
MFKDDKNLLQAEIIAIGNEVISGLIQDTNGRYLSKQLHLLGINVPRITAVGDDKGSISEVVEGALERVDIVIITGGLGSTHDDITKEVLAQIFNSKMILDHKVRRMLEVSFKKRSQEVPKNVRSQYEVPVDATILYNEKGTAPGFFFKRDEKKLFSLPGVPLEMEHLFDAYVRPDLKKIQKGVIGHRIIKTVGLTEASLWEKFGPVERLERLVTVASLPSYLEVKIRLSYCAESLEEVEIRLGEAEVMVMASVGKWVYGKDNDSLEGIVGKLLKDKGRTLAVGESCTGGLIGHRLTQEPGSSRYFLEDIVAYSNEAKTSRLEVSSALIQKHGAVSAEVALSMAEGIRKTSGADIGLSVTGVAGPGASNNKPTGTVFIGISEERRSNFEEFRFYNDRRRNKERSAQAALELLRRWLMNY